MTNEQKQRYKEAKNKGDRDKYHNITDEQNKKYKHYLREYYKKYYAEKKLNYKIIQHDYDDNDDSKIIKFFNHNLKL